MENTKSKYSKKQILTGILFACLVFNSGKALVNYGLHTVETSIIGFAVSGIFLVADLLIMIGLLMPKGHGMIRVGTLALLIGEIVSFVQVVVIYRIFDPIILIMDAIYLLGAFLLYRFVSNVYGGKQVNVAKAKKEWYIPAFCICLVFVIETALSSVFMSIFILGIAYLFLASTVLDHVLSEKEKEEHNNALLMFAIGAVVVLGVLFFVTDRPSISDDIAYDEDGFLGYSDGFWEWMGKQ